MERIAHIKEDGSFQTAKEHLQDVALLSKEFSIDDLKELCYVAGLYHDAGKYLDSFQERIRGNRAIHVEHSIVGAQIIAEKERDLFPESLLLEAVIAGHHSGIPDLGLPTDTAEDITLTGRLKRRTEDYSSFFSEIEYSLGDLNVEKFRDLVLKDCETKEDLIEKFAFIVRYVFSCLVDADSIDTAKFILGRKEEPLQADFKKCLQKLNKRFEKFVSVTDLQKARGEIQKQIYQKADVKDNFFLLNMPTGSGKTLSSTKFALKRAIKGNKQRIIYVIPYNSIIDQTYSELKNIFGDSAEILRHQSTFSYNDDGADEEYHSRALSACENWEAQIIITTSVQFFESVYDNKRKRLRKLHNYANSVIIFDEIHLMPVDRMQPCLRAVEYISTLLHSDIIFCTATMPDFKKLFNQYTSLRIPLVDLAEDKSKFNLFAKCTYKFLGCQSDDELVERAQKYSSSLIVTNTRHKAQELYQLAKGKKYHLSTYMTPCDRMQVIDLIKQELKNLERDYPNLENVPEERRILLISTSLIEAGVDLDFECAFRELTGLDSILQTGGRCNREGKRGKGEVFVFVAEDSANIPLNDIRIEVMKGIIQTYPDFSSEEAISDYYNQLFNLNGERIVSQSIVQRMPVMDIGRVPFASYNFRMIDSHQISIFVPRDENGRNIRQVMQDQHIVNTRAVQKYCCSVNEQELKMLLDAGAVHNYETEVYCLDNDDYYDPKIGIVLESTDYYI